MAARKREENESFDKYRTSLVSEEYALSRRLSVTYGLGQSGSILVRATRRFMRAFKTTPVEKPFDYKKANKARRAARVARRVRR